MVRTDVTGTAEREILASIADVDEALADLFTPWPCLCGRILPVGSGLGGLCPECSTVANL